MTDTEHPATCLVHWPSGAVPACEVHASGLIKLGNFMGAHIVCTALTEPAQCTNCINESKDKRAEQ